MEIDIGAVAALGGVALWLAPGVWRRQGKAGGRALAALATVARLTELVAHIQQHRGMSGAWRSGDASFASRLPAKQREVEAVLAALCGDAALEEGERLPCFTAADVSGLQAQWRELLAVLGRLSPEESFQHHCRLLGEVLGWLAAVGEVRIAPVAAGAALSDSVRKVVADLPALAECLGQARALGSAVAARGRCAPVARVRLHFLVSRATELLTRAAQGSAGAQARRPAEGFLLALRERMLLSASVDMDAATCFRLGTEAVDAVYAWLAQERAALEHALQSASAKAGSADGWAAQQQARCRS